MMQNNHNIKYVVDRNASRKYKKTKKLKIVNKKRFLMSIGIGMTMIHIAVYASGMIPLPEEEMTKVEVPQAIVETQNITYEQSIDVPTQNFVDQYINKYSNIYGLNPNKVKDIFHKNREYFNSINYLNLSNYQNYNEEVEVLTFVRHLYQKPGDFGVEKNSLLDPNFISNDNIFEEQTVKHFSDLLGVDPVLTLAIEYQESTSNGQRYGSDVYNICNNPAGLINPDTSFYWEFPSKEAGIFEHVYQLKKNYIDKGLTSPEEIKKTYAPDFAENDPNNYNLYWVDNVNSLMEEIRNDPNIFNDVAHNKKV